MSIGIKQNVKMQNVDQRGVNCPSPCFVYEIVDSMRTFTTGASIVFVQCKLIPISNKYCHNHMMMSKGWMSCVIYKKKDQKINLV